jgi:hypothetical protein
LLAKDGNSEHDDPVNATGRSVVAQAPNTAQTDSTATHRGEREAMREAG